MSRNWRKLPAGQSSTVRDPRVKQRHGMVEFDHAAAGSAAILRLDTRSLTGGAVAAKTGTSCAPPVPLKVIVKLIVAPRVMYSRMATQASYPAYGSVRSQA